MSEAISDCAQAVQSDQVLDDSIIGTLQENTRETIAVALSAFKDHPFCDVRVVFEKEGSPQPTGKGMAIRPDSLPAPIKLPQQAHAEARCSDGR